MAEKKNVEELRVLTDTFRASHVHVFKPSKVNKNDTKENYSIEMLFEKSTTNLEALQKPLFAAAGGKWGERSEWPKGLMSPIRDGDKPHGPKKELKPEHKGMWVVRASSSAEYSKPYCVGLDPDVALVDEKEFYSGCYARAALKALAWEFAGKNGVKFILDGVQFVRHGKPFGGKRPANQMFGRLESEGADAAPFGSDDSSAVEETQTEGFL